MFCKNCGTENPDNAAFCKDCGAQLEQPEEGGPSPAGSETTFTQPPDPAPAPGPVSPPPSPTAASRYKGIGIAAVAVAAIAVIVLLVNLLGGRSYKDTVNRLFDAVMDLDARAIVDLIPEDVVEEAVEESGYGSRNGLIQSLEEQLNSSGGTLLGYLSQGLKLDFTVVGDEDLSGEQLRQLRQSYEDRYDVDIKGAKTVTVEISYELLGFSESQSTQVSVIQVGRSWYLDVLNMSSLF